MNQGFIFNLVGCVLLTTALVLHIVCVVTPFYSAADMDGFPQELANLAKTDPSKLGLGPGASHEMVQAAMGGFAFMSGGYINFGMWKLCIEASSLDEKLSLRWSTETSFNDEGMIKTIKSSAWMRGVQAMAIIGTIFQVAALGVALLNVISKSKGDRLRLLYLVILFFCVAAGIFILIGDIIMAANHRSALDAMVSQDPTPAPAEIYDLFTKRFTLSWGFVLDIITVALSILAGIAHFIGGRIANTFSGIV